MNCVICKDGALLSGFVTVTLERGQATLVVKRVPGRVCDNCGEEYLDEATTVTLLTLADEAIAAGVQVAVRDYIAA
jgi:YgiT-type zinc finger domain-containing protein